MGMQVTNVEVKSTADKILIQYVSQREESSMASDLYAGWRHGGGHREEREKNTFILDSSFQGLVRHSSRGVWPSLDICMWSWITFLTEHIDSESSVSVSVRTTWESEKHLGEALSQGKKGTGSEKKAHKRGGKSERCGRRSRSINCLGWQENYKTEVIIKIAKCYREIKENKNWKILDLPIKMAVVTSMCEILSKCDKIKS